MSNEYAKNNMSADNKNLKSNLTASNNITDSLMNSVGLYSRKQIEDAKFNKFSRFGRILDPYGKMYAGREYLFFVKPDLHLCSAGGVKSDDGSNPIYQLNITGQGSSADDEYIRNGLVMNPQLHANPYFKYLIASRPDVVKQLQYSIDNSNPFCYLLSSSVNSNLGLDSSSSKTMDNSSTVFGTSYNYLQDAEDSDEMYSFSLEFMDDKYLNTYHFFKAYTEYHIARKSGFITPPTLEYYQNRRLHNTMGIYKFIVGEDMETLVYWAYLVGVIPTSSPREAFQDPSFPDGLTFSVNFEAAFIEDMSPVIISQFNKLMMPVIKNKGGNTSKWLPIVNQNYMRSDDGMNTYDSSLQFGTDSNAYEYSMNTRSRVNGTLPYAALVDTKPVGNETYGKFRLRWYG